MDKLVFNLEVNVDKFIDAVLGPLLVAWQAFQNEPGLIVLFVILVLAVVAVVRQFTRPGHTMRL